MSTDLISFIRALPADLVGRVSRIRIEPAPGRCKVVARFAGLQPRAPQGVHADGTRAIPRGPVSASDARGVADRNPPVTLMMREALDDAEGWIDSADIAGQLAELQASGIVGGLNVERVGRNTVVSTHAATQAERNAWLTNLAGSNP